MTYLQFPGNTCATCLRWRRSKSNPGIGFCAGLGTINYPNPDDLGNPTIAIYAMASTDIVSENQIRTPKDFGCNQHADRSLVKQPSGIELRVQEFLLGDRTHMPTEEEWSNLP